MRTIIATALKRTGRASVRLAAAAALAFAPTGGAAELRIATTSTLNDSGLLDALLPAFTRETGLRVKPLVAGTGQALRMAERGDADVVWSHSPSDEERFVAAGYGTGRSIVMTNAFLLAGPRDDPARIAGERDVAVALRKIAAARARFVSRADESGTHRKEMMLWQAAGLIPAGPWYLAAGVGMGAALRIADERGAYILTDEATYAAQRRAIDLVVLSAGDPRLANIYAVIPVDPKKVPGVDATAAATFVRWVTAGNGRTMIAGFRIAGEPVFHVPAK